MNIINQFQDAKTEGEAKRIYDKYLDILPDNQKPKLEYWYKKTLIRIQIKEPAIRLCEQYCNN